MTRSSKEAAVYVAPARYVLTVLHRRGPTPACPPVVAAEALDGWTACGRPMKADELWRAVDSRDGDQLCTGCMLPGSVRAAVEDVEVTLW
jgi:hypothetical protein